MSYYKKLKIIALLVISFIVTPKVFLFAEDTINITNNSYITCNVIQFDNYSDIELLPSDDIIHSMTSDAMYGYLVIQIDSNLHIENISDSVSDIQTAVHWIESLDNIGEDSIRYYYSYYGSLVSKGVTAYINGYRDDLSIFLFYYSLFNYINRPIKISYLFYLNREFLMTSLLINKTMWFKKNKNIGYFIFRTYFNTAKLYQRKQGKYFLIPTSYLKLFESMSDEEMLQNGFYKSDKTVLFK